MKKSNDSSLLEGTSNCWVYGFVMAWQSAINNDWPSTVSWRGGRTEKKRKKCILLRYEIIIVGFVDEACSCRMSIACSVLRQRSDVVQLFFSVAEKHNWRVDEQLAKRDECKLIAWFVLLFDTLQSVFVVFWFEKCLRTEWIFHALANMLLLHLQVVFTSAWFSHTSLVSLWSDQLVAIHSLLKSTLGSVWQSMSEVLHVKSYAVIICRLPSPLSSRPSIHFSLEKKHTAFSSLFVVFLNQLGSLHNVRALRYVGVALAQLDLIYENSLNRLFNISPAWCDDAQWDSRSLNLILASLMPLIASEDEKTKFNVSFFFGIIITERSEPLLRFETYESEKKLNHKRVNGLMCVYDVNVVIEAHWGSRDWINFWTHHRQHIAYFTKLYSFEIYQEMPLKQD